MEKSILICTVQNPDGSFQITTDQPFTFRQRYFDCTKEQAQKEFLVSLNKEIEAVKNGKIHNNESYKEWYLSNVEKWGLC